HLMSDLSHAGRVAIHAACEKLTSAGYSAERLAGKRRRLDIIAWKQEKIVGIVVRSSRRGGITRYSSLVQTLADMVRKHLFPGEVQVWTHDSHEWRTYQVLPGGAVLITGRGI
ncbi:MAG TPA: hypothetical protein PLY78_11520, partial [Methanospirillum sp.]|nr:hypothetical protein [Methanospirillum sp.]